MFNRGSEWNKWDLHVHTPASVLHNEYNDNWDLYVKDLFQKAIENNVSGIGITDYYFPDGYKKIKNEYLSDSEKMISILGEELYEKSKEIYLFPNIEFRIDKLILGKERDLKWNRKVNYHLLLSDEINIDIIETEIIQQLHFDYCSEPGGKPEKRIFTKDNLIEFGNKLILEQASFNQQNPLLVGMLNSCISLDELANIIGNNKKFKNKYLFGLPVDEDLSDVSWNSQGHSTRKNLIKQAHVIFSSNPKTISFCRGEFHDDTKRGFEKEFGNIKPCVWGSDAHSVVRLFKPDENRYTWIKGDLSFLGLKQVVYDPISRVSIQEVNPQNKSPYQTIKRVRFIDRVKGNFTENWISINKDLTTIIGGKSSGKSLLLYFIAKSINCNEVDNILKLIEGSSYSDLNIDFEVEWDNGTISKLSNTEDTKPITYIPQLYINRLAEVNGKKQLNELIEDIICQNDKYKSFRSNKKNEIINIKSKISELVNLHDIYSQSYISTKNELDKIGVKSSIEGEIKRLNYLVDELRKKSGFSVEEERAFLHLNNRKINLQKRFIKLTDLYNISESVSELINSKTQNYKENIRNDISSELGLSNNSIYIDKMFNVAFKEIENISRSVKKYHFDRTIKISKEKDMISMFIDDIDIKLKPFVLKFQDKKVLEEIMKKQIEENKKIDAIAKIEMRLINISSEGSRCISEIKEEYVKLLATYNDLSIELLKPEYSIGDDMQITPHVNFNFNLFERFISLFDMRGNLNNLLSPLHNKSNELEFNLNTHTASIFDILDNTKNKNCPAIKSSTSRKDIIQNLFGDYFSLEYEVKYKGDEIIQMSPGKRGLVLLNLLLHLSNASHPILIDQPEDNLDNRTIYDQLNKFIRERKKSRQIILVTHNANLVVSADSECVIVANQSGQGKNMENEKYRFEYIYGGLENSFEKQNERFLLKAKGIRQHVCEILEGGKEAFREREIKYGLRH